MACSTHASKLTTYLQTALAEGHSHAAANASTAGYVSSAHLVKLRHAARVSPEQLASVFR